MSKKDDRSPEQYCSSNQSKSTIKSESDGSSWKQSGVSASTKSLHSSSSYDNKSLYDSGRTDSGFLSGANLLSSEQYLSEEISTPSSPTKSKEFDSGEIKGSMRLDSGVDVGLDDKFSSLSLVDTATNNLSKSSNTKSKSEISCNNITGSYESNISLQNPRSIQVPTSHVDTSANPSSPLFLPPELYFQQDKEGDTQLHLAILHSFIEVVYHLIKMAPKRSDLDIKNDEYQTPLHFAVLTGQPNIIRWLLNEGALPDVRDMHGNTPLHLAVHLQDVACMNALLAPIPLDSQKVIDRHSNLLCVNLPNYDGQTCLHVAICGGNIEIVKRLLDVGADVNAREYKGGYTPLHLAIEEGNEVLCKFLLEHCPSTIDIEMPNYKGYTPYQLACKVCPHLADRLVHYGAEWYPMEDSEESNLEEDEDEMIGQFNSFRTNGIVDVSA